LRAQSSEKHGRHGTWILCHTVSVQTSAMLKYNCVTLIFTAKIRLVISHELFSDFKDSFCFFRGFAFLLFHALYSSPTFIHCRSALLFIARTLVFVFFKMGVNVRATTLYQRSQRIFLFAVIISLRFYRRCFIFAGRTPYFIRWPNSVLHSRRTRSVCQLL